MAKEQDDQEEMITLSAVKDMGFNKKMIDELLPEPIEMTNPYYKSGPPMKKWSKSVVEKAMETDRYKELNAKRLKHSAAGKAAAATKYAKTMADTQAAIAKIEVPVMSKEDLESKAWQSQKEHYDGKGRMIGGPDDDTMKRWMVNYLRHELTGYDSELSENEGKVGVKDAHDTLKDAVLDKIADAYPYLADACEDQKRRNHMTAMERWHEDNDR